MKRLARSNITKFIALVMCVVFACLITNNIFTFFSGSYFFEEDVNYSFRMRRYRIDVYHSVLNSLKDSTAVEGQYDIEYYANCTDKKGVFKEISNSENKDFDYYKNAKCSVIVVNTQDMLYDNAEWSTRDSDIKDLTLFIKISDDVYGQYKVEWQNSKIFFETAINHSIIYLIVSCVLVIYLCWVAGRNNEDEEIHMLLIDRMLIEISLAIFIVIIFAGIFGIAVVGEYLSYSYESAYFLKNMMSLIMFGVGVFTLGIIAFLLSFIRNLKNKTFLKRCITYKVIMFAVRIIKKIFNALIIAKDNLIMFMTGGSINIILILSLLVYTFIIALFGVALYEEDVFILLGILVFIGVGIFMVTRVNELNKIRQGIKKIRNGDINYKIDGCKKAITKDMADDINEIADGIIKSVDREVRAERMKSELITNVSHDLKTPLTSIINYSDLLSKEDLTPKEANDYVEIIKQKSERLKNLTNDLFDISKVQSGVEVISLEEINIALLLSQSLGELDQNIKESSLEFINAIPEDEVNVMADGRKMSRVFENLIVNILKYSMDKSRVYITMNEMDKRIKIEFKNISNYALNLDGSQLMERFTRGDSSRATEGSGLGLAIAKSYTQACGGDFDVVTDGDLFKVVIEFDRA